MHCMKLLGQSLMARDFERQVAEIQVRSAILNRYTALGIPWRFQELLVDQLHEPQVLSTLAFWIVIQI